MADNWHRARLDHRAQQSEAIATAALSLLLEHGASALTMAAIATAADISRQTLYRYYPDIDAVLVGIAELIASHDDAFEAQVVDQSDPATQLDVMIRTVGHSESHDARGSSAVRATLPPHAREVLAAHENRIVQLLASILERGIDDGIFRDDIEPAADAPLILGLAAASRHHPERAVALVHRMVDLNPKENPT